MPKWIVCLALGVLPAFGGGRPAMDPPVALYTEFEQKPPNAVLDAIQEEVAAIMSPAKLRFAWYPLAEARGRRLSPHVAVVHFKGECDTEGLLPEGGYPGPLGWTHISDGHILPFVDINCLGIRIFVQCSLVDLPTPTRDSAFGKAVARVLAHELYHVLANTQGHSSEGIAKARYSVQELLAPIFQLGRKEQDALRSSTAGWTLEPAAGGE